MPELTKPSSNEHAHSMATHDAGTMFHDKHAGHSVALFRDRFWISLVLTVPTLIWGHMLQDALGLQAPRFPGSQLIPPLFGAATYLYGGHPFLQGAVHELRERLPGMMTLIALAISVAFVFSAAVMFGFPGMPLWEELATLVSIMLLGHWMEMRSVSQAQGALKELARLLPSHATRIRGDTMEEVPIAVLAVGDMVLIRPGASVPALSISTTLGARNGLLVRNRRGLETARNIDVVVMDKTGTLTRGEFGVVQMGVVPGLSEQQALSIAAAVEADSEDGAEEVA